MEILLTLVGIVGAVAFYGLYYRTLELTLSRGAPTFMTGAVFLWGMPMVLMVLAIFTAKWRLALAVLLIGAAVVAGCYAGAMIARWTLRDRFEGAIFGGLIALLVLGFPAKQLALHWL